MDRETAIYAFELHVSGTLRLMVAKVLAAGRIALPELAAKAGMDVAQVQECMTRPVLLTNVAALVHACGYDLRLNLTGALPEPVKHEVESE